MLAIFKTGGKQYSVKTGQILKVEKLEGNKGDKVSFNEVLALTSDTEKNFGTPKVEGAVVQAKILEQIRDKKIIVFKKRRRQNYRSTKGHRQYLTVLQIESITIGSKKSTLAKKDIVTKPKTTTVSEKNQSKEKISIKKTTTKKTTVKKTIKKTIKKTTANKTVKKNITKKVKE